MENPQLNQIKQKFMHPNAVSLHIERVPIEIVEAFKKYANDEFVGDYGMCLKSLVDMLLLEPQKMAAINALLEDHEIRLQALEEKKHTPKPIKVLSGRGIRQPIEENGGIENG